jgi:hypothetical protein
VNFLKSVLHYASAAWSLVAGAVTDPAQALLAVWHFAGSVQSLLDHLFSTVNRDLLTGVVFYLGTVDHALQDYLSAIGRIARWIWGKQVDPVYQHLRRMIIGLQRWTLAWISKLVAMIVTYYWASLRYADQQVGIERSQRTAAVTAARQYSIRLAKGVWTFVQESASRGYNSQTDARESVISKIADDLAVRNPVIKQAVTDLVKLTLDAAEIDDPVIRLALKLALAKVIDALGVDKVAGTLLATLVNDLAGGAQPSTLQEVAAAIAARLAALEGQWADFMVAGGPEVEQAGQAWKAWASIAGDAALVAFFAQAAADPAAWAREVNDTAVTVVNGTVAVIADLIKGA